MLPTCVHRKGTPPRLSTTPSSSAGRKTNATASSLVSHRVCSRYSVSVRIAHSGFPHRHELRRVAGGSNRGSRSGAATGAPAPRLVLLLDEVPSDDDNGVPVDGVSVCVPRRAFVGGPRGTGVVTAPVVAVDDVGSDDARSLASVFGGTTLSERTKYGSRRPGAAIPGRSLGRRTHSHEGEDATTCDGSILRLRLFPLPRLLSSWLCHRKLPFAAGAIAADQCLNTDRKLPSSSCYCNTGQRLCRGAPSRRTAVAPRRCRRRTTKHVEHAGQAVPHDVAGHVVADIGRTPPHCNVTVGFTLPTLSS